MFIKNRNSIVLSLIFVSTLQAEKVSEQAKSIFIAHCKIINNYYNGDYRAYNTVAEDDHTIEVTKINGAP